MENYQYTPLPEGKNIRVLTILPSTDKHGRIDCNIETAPLDESANYTALSYSWGMNEDGDASLCESIYIAGRILPITKNLYQGLLRIRVKEAALRYWIDAVCINQQDIPERNSQVALMAPVYEHAAATSIWLGEGLSEKDDLDAAFLWNVMFDMNWYIRRREDEVHNVYGTKEYPYQSNPDIEDRIASHQYGSIEIVGALRALVDPCNWKATYRRECSDLKPASSKIWRYCTTAMERVASVLERRYFSRLWIVQELYHARQGTINMLWGPCSIDNAQFEAGRDTWTWFAREVGFVVSAAIREPSLDRATESLLRQLEKQVKQYTYSIGKFEFPRTHDTPSNLSLITLMVQYRESRCLDDRDRLFALLSLVPAVEADFPVDYSLSFGETCMRFTDYLICKGDFTAILEQLSDVGTDAILPDIGLPSWALDLRAVFIIPATNWTKISAHRGPDGLLHCYLPFAGRITHVSSRDDSPRRRLRLEGPGGHVSHDLPFEVIINTFQVNDYLFIPEPETAYHKCQVFMRRTSKDEIYKIIQVHTWRDGPDFATSAPAPIMIA